MLIPLLDSALEVLYTCCNHDPVLGMLITGFCLGVMYTWLCPCSGYAYPTHVFSPWSDAHIPDYISTFGELIPLLDSAPEVTYHAPVFGALIPLLDSAPEVMYTWLRPCSGCAYPLLLTAPLFLVSLSPSGFFLLNMITWLRPFF